MQAQTLILFQAPSLKQSAASSSTTQTRAKQVNNRDASQSNLTAEDYIQLGNKYSNSGNELHLKIECYRKAFDLYKKEGNTKQQASTLEAIARMHHQQGNQQLALEELKQTISLYRYSHHNSFHNSYALLSRVYKTLGNYPEALRYGQAAIKNSLDIHDTTSLSFYYLQLGYLFHDLKQPDEALKSCENAMQHVQESRKDDDVYNTLSLAVNVMLEQKKAKEALHYIGKVTKDTPPGSVKSAAMVTLFKAQCHIALKQYPLARKFIIRSEEYLNEIDKSNDPAFLNDSYRMGVYQVAGELYMATKEYSKSRYYFNKMVQVNEQVNYLSESVLHQYLLFKLDSAQGNFKEALQHHQRYLVLKDSIFNEAKSQQFANLQIQYETQAKVQSIELLTKRNEMQQAKLKQKDFQQTVFLIGSVLLLLLLILVYSRYRLKQKSTKLLEGKQEEINRKNESLRQLLEEKESLLHNKDELLEEKRWLLKEVHHRVKNNLQIVMSLLNSQAAYLDDDKALTAISDSQHRVQAMSLIHHKLYQSDKMGTIAMDEYLKELVNNLSDSYSLHDRIRFQLDIAPIEMDVAVAVPLGLLINEAVTNCLKYAFPEHKEGVVYLSLIELSRTQYQLTIADNGIGVMDTSDLLPGRSLGMKLMKGLSKQLGGSLTLDNTEGLKINVLFTPTLITQSDGLQTK
ncbi:histidine kinase dimerization/phosphoacceptor domain -containing protein [Desertivirga brevis]|uniref:histidine kinase dimerization/phosphoacceptor domain -containing protein n=1 Tax=Desertivirga brevis TaxID=2810310 RepID=UPI001A97824E|nr:histidine kinase dimerization/phosphoacceptor domain -containing protein [Pedobacter sp. SYSU D00873]